MNLNQHQKLMNSSMSRMKMTNEYGLYIAKQCKVTITYHSKGMDTVRSWAWFAPTEVNQEAPNSLQEGEVWQCLFSLKKETFFIALRQSFAADRRQREGYLLRECWQSAEVRLSEMSKRFRCWTPDTSLQIPLKEHYTDKEWGIHLINKLSMLRVPIKGYL